MKDIFDCELSRLKGVGEKRKEIYKKLGVYDIYSLLNFYPKSYIDYTETTPLSELYDQGEFFILCKVVEKKGGFNIRKGLDIYSVVCVDEFTNKVVVKIFNSRYNYESLKVSESYYFQGRCKKNKFALELTAKSFVHISAKEKIIASYRLSLGLTNLVVRNNIKEALGYVNNIVDPLPPEVILKYKLAPKSYAIKNIHHPSSKEDLNRARTRLIFEDCLYLQLGILHLKQRDKGATRCIINDRDLSDFYENLPFELTPDQKGCIDECLDDMQKDIPMNRLIQGDVGSGKTVVCAAISYSAYKHGFQACIMAPTEILAIQHYSTFVKFFSKLGLNVALLTGSTSKKQKESIKAGINSGIYDIVIGTHAIIQKDCSFKNLGLVVTDEQHRFGVAQRSSLIAKGENPHVCVMSATPIPRTLALIIYGDLDISTIDKPPTGRKPVKTYAILPNKRKDAFGFIKTHLDQGQQAYIICPLVAPGELDLIDATQHFEELSQSDFKSYRLALLHGKLTSSQKEEIMQKFKDNQVDLLISTTVVEVGVDVPNSTIMMIENADRFGLSQLHQLRGRVGRGDLQSHCILVSSSDSPKISNRLKFMCKTNDGFLISKYDLKIRGAGDFFGERQHGLPNLKVANLIENADIFKETLHIAKEILTSDPDLSKPENRYLKTEVNLLFNDVEYHCFN